MDQQRQQGSNDAPATLPAATFGKGLTSAPDQPAAARRPRRRVWLQLAVLFGVAGALVVGFVVVPNALVDRQIRAAAVRLDALGPQLGLEKEPQDETPLGVHAQLTSHGVSWVSDGRGHVALSRKGRCMVHTFGVDVSTELVGPGGLTFYGTCQK